MSYVIIYKQNAIFMMLSISVASRSGITLAIGDGANDVPMIQGAHVGIGERMWRLYQLMDVDGKLMAFGTV